ncbi:MAG: hypothetical protein LUD15_12905, partial [Bacteroides sp.]|nr:hypothetical protein [Bacteroides sp.]
MRPLFSCFCLLTLSVSAQEVLPDSTLIRTVVVEQEYNPEIMDASKIHILPQMQEPALDKSEVVYTTSSSPLIAAGAGEVIRPFTMMEQRQKVKPGYLRLGYGSHGNVDAIGNYLFTLSERDELNFFIGLEGVNDKVDLPDYLSYSVDDWKLRYYRTRWGLDYAHTYRQAILDVTGQFGVDNFGYMIHDSQSNDPLYSLSSQNHNYGDLHVGVRSTDADRCIWYDAEINFLFFDKKHNLAQEDNREMVVRSRADVSGSLYDEQKRVGAELVMNNYFYSYPGLQDYTAVTLTPYFEYRTESFFFRGGAHIDFATGDRKNFQVAPDVKIRYNFSDSYLLYLNVVGGKQSNDYRTVQQVNPYLLPEARALDSYKQLEALAGFKASPVEGLWFDLFGGYDLITDDLLMDPRFFMDKATPCFIPVAKNIKHYIVGASVKYSYRDIIDLGVKVTKYGWNYDKEEDGYYYMMKPDTKFDINFQVKPVADLKVYAFYKLINWNKAEVFTGRASSMEKMNTVGNLGIGADYGIWKDLSLFLKLDNLLNKQYEYYYGYSSQG